MGLLTKTEPLDWRRVTQFVEVVAEPLTCFKIVPDNSVSNYSNYKFFKDVHELERDSSIKAIINSVAELGKGILRRDLKNGLKLVYRAANDYIWYEILIKEESISFYVLCSKSHEEYVRLKLEQSFPHAPIDVVDESETFLPYDNTVIADLKLQRHNFFSLRTDYSERAQPIEDVLMTAEDVKGTDVLKFSMRVQPFDTDYWSYKSEEWEQLTKKGKPPQRLRVSKKGILGSLFSLSDQAFQKLGELFREIHEIAFKKNDINKHITINHSSPDMREIGDTTRQTNYKMNAPVFKVNMMIGSHSENDTRRLMNLKSMSTSFVDLKDTNNALIRTSIKNQDAQTWPWAYKEMSEHRITPLTHLDVDYNIMSDKELGKVQMLPTTSIQKKYKGRMDALQQRENGIPEAFMDDSGIFIGKATLKGESIDIFIPDKNPDELVLPLMVVGLSGSGKDTLAANWVVENALKGRGAVIPDIIDEKGRGMSDAIIKCLPPEKLMILDFSNEHYSPYLDWAEAANSTNRFSMNRRASELVKFFESEDDAAGNQTERFLREASAALPNGSMIEIGMLFISEKLRTDAIKDCEKRGDASTANFWRAYHEESDGRKRQISSPILNRLHKLVGDPTLKPIFGQKPNGSIDFYKALKEGKVIICKIPKTSFSTTGIRTLVHFIMVKTWLTKQMMSTNGDKCHSILVLNEPHQIFTKGTEITLEEILPESRKFGLQVMTLFHDFAQVDKKLADIMTSSGANFILLKQRGEKTWNRFKHRLENDYSTEDCMAINNHEAMIGFMSGGIDQPIVHVKMNDLPYNRGLETYNNGLFEARSLKEYGKPIEEIMREIQEVENTLLKVNAKKSK